MAKLDSFLAWEIQIKDYYDLEENLFGAIWRFLFTVGSYIIAVYLYRVLHLYKFVFNNYKK